MPNHIMNRLRLEGDQNRIDELLKSVKGKDSVLDFNRIIPMPESLNIEAGSRTDNGLKAYKDFVYVYTFAGIEKKDLLNIPKEKEEIFLRTRQDIRRDEWELGKAAFQNEQKYGAATWYEWARENWGTKWSSYNAELGEDNTIMFNTAWSRAMPVIQKLAENFPDLYFEYCWADEDLGVNVGMAEFENGEVTFDEFYNAHSYDAYELAADLWDIDLAEEVRLRKKLRNRSTMTALSLTPTALLSKWQKKLKISWSMFSTESEVWYRRENVFRKKRQRQLIGKLLSITFSM